MCRRIEIERRPWFSIPRLKGLLTSPVPAWKVAVSGALVVALIAGLAILVTVPAPPITHLLKGLGPAKALAAEIALECPEVQAAFGEEAGELTVLRVEIRNGWGTVFLTAEGVNRFLAANVHLKERGVIDIQVLEVEAKLSYPEITEAEREWVMSIAKADPRVQELLAKGARIENVAPIFAMHYTFPTEVQETPKVIVDSASVKMRLGDRMWTVWVNVEEEQVIHVAEHPRLMVVGDIPRLGEEEELKAIDIARAHPLVQEILDKGAVIMGAHYPTTVTYENGKLTMFLRYGPDKVGVYIMYRKPVEIEVIAKPGEPDKFVLQDVQSWTVLVNLTEERVVSIKEHETFFCEEANKFISEERVIFQDR
jgi:hypothetical protein